MTNGLMRGSLFDFARNGVCLFQNLPMANSLQNGPSNGHSDPESTFARFRRRITESRFFMLSLLVHAIIVIIAGSIVLYTVTAPPEPFAGAGDIAGLTESQNIEITESPREPVKIADLRPQAPEVGGIVSGDIINTTLPSRFTVPVGTAAGPIVLRPPGVPDAGPISIPGNLGPQGIPKDFCVRFGPGKIGIGKSLGMKEKALGAVERSLKWLRENQNPDGSWGDGNRSAMTGLALLCFLGYGELPDSKEYGYTINHAVDWLVENGTKFEGRLGMEKTFTQHGVYEHGIATYALGEFFALTKDGRVKELLTQAVAHIVQGQGPGGGWMYAFDKTVDDLSVSGWQIQALKAAHLTGLKLPGVDRALDKAVSYLERVQGPNGGYGYRGPEDRYSLTGVGILSRLFWKGGTGELRTGMTWLIEETEKNHPVKYRGASADLYAWYYHTQASLMFGGKAWEKWNKWFQDELITAQSPDGSWPVPGAKGHGPQADPGRTGAVYRTTLCTLMLEVFYRYSAVHKG